MEDVADSKECGWKNLEGKSIRLQCGEALIEGELTRFYDPVLYMQGVEIWVPGKYRTDSLWLYIHQSKVDFCFEIHCAIESSEYAAYHEQHQPVVSQSEAMKEMLKAFPQLPKVEKE